MLAKISDEGAKANILFVLLERLVIPTVLIFSN